MKFRADKVSLYVALAPITKLTNTTSLAIKESVSEYKLFHRTTQTLGIYELLGENFFTSVVGKYKISHELKDRTLDFHQNVEFKSDEENFYLVFHRWVLVNGELFREKVWKDTIPRDFQ